MSDVDPEVPRHLAIIMDGNGRWARSQGLPRLEGHRAGAESVRAAIRFCRRTGIRTLTLYSFSTENWARPEDEVAGLMALLSDYLRSEVDELVDEGIRLHAIGELDRLPPEVGLLLNAAVLATSGGQALDLVLALSYGSRSEIVSAVRQIAMEVQAGALDPAQIDADRISSHLYTAQLPDPDLLIRTSGELRLSNFLLWQLAYSELYVTDVFWPDFRETHLEAALAAYRHRQRRFGRTGRQIEEGT